MSTMTPMASKHFTLYQEKLKQHTRGLLVCCLGWFTSRIAFSNFQLFTNFFRSWQKNDQILLEYIDAHKTLL